MNQDQRIYSPDEETFGSDQPAMGGFRSMDQAAREPGARMYMPDEETIGREEEPAPREMVRNAPVYMPDEETIGGDAPDRKPMAQTRQPNSTGGSGGYNPDGDTIDGDAPLPPQPKQMPFQKDGNTRRDGVKKSYASQQNEPETKKGMNLPFKSMNAQDQVQPPAACVVPAAVSRSGRKPEPDHISTRIQNDGISERKAKPVSSDGPRISLKEMEAREISRFNAEMSSYEQQMAQWKSRLWIPPLMLVLVAAAALVAGAFMGALGVILVILLAGATVAILLPLGKLNWIRKPKKPQKQQLEMKTPEFGSVYSVRLRLQSVNLAKPVEVTIRKEEQLIGSDPSVCLQALEYKGISRRHFTIISRQEHGHTEYLIRDENSKNGTRLNDKKLMPGAVYPLRIGDQITLAGRYSFRVMSDAF